MMSFLPVFGLPFIFLVDYLAIIVWLMRTADRPQRTLRFSLPTFFIAITVVAIHLGLFAAFLSVRAGNS